MAKQYNPTERKGINFTERIFLNFGWIFREQPVLDFGIDAQVEVCEKGKPTGRVIALQVKSGVSYFGEEYLEEIIYRGELKHLDYWTNHSLPVILVLYDPRRRAAFWRHIRADDDAICRSNRGWHVSVPKNQRLSKDAKATLKSVSLPNFLAHARYRDLADIFESQSGSSKFANLLDAIHAADGSIDVVSPTADQLLFLALAFCSHRVRVRLVTGPDVPDNAISELLSGDHEGMEWRIVTGRLHEKLIVLDNFLVLSGSMNLTEFSWRGDFENVCCFYEPRRVAEAVKIFEGLWQHDAVPIDSMRPLLNYSAVK